MSTFFPAGGLNADVGPWWRVLHSSLEAGADIATLRLLHAVGAGPMTHDHCVRMEQALTPDVACVRYDPTSLLVIEPGVTDLEVLRAAQKVLNVTTEQLKIWRAVGVHDDGLDFVPLDVEHIEAASGENNPSSLKHDIVLTDAEFSYFPMWDVHAGEIIGYVCENVWNTGEGSYVSEEALDAFFAKHRHVYALDKEALHKAVAQAQDFLDRYMFTNIIVPVHYSTMSNPDLATLFIEACNDGVWSVRDNVIFEIIKVPSDVDGDTLYQAINALTPFGQAIWLRLDHGFSNFGAIPMDLIGSVGLGFQYDVRSSEDIHAELTSLTQATREQGCTRHAHGLQDMDTCISAVNLEYDYISSVAIAPPLDVTQPEAMAQPSDVFRAMLKR
ncbi:hypothetical protein [Magnetovibrio sp.]|uniref:hypothetical protein n=1 Tax=Magnetovibrio sp. TaxID=2024836 RepID=UPI002F939E1A